MDKVEMKAAAARLLYNDNRDTADFDALVGFIDSVALILDKFRWIPVQERLPKNGQNVVLYTDHGAVFWGYYDHKWKCWRTTKTVNVTHWRLPDGPEDWKVN